MTFGNLQTASIYCALQVSFTAIFGLLLVNWLVRTKPALAATVGYATICVIMALSVFALFPAPRFVPDLFAKPAAPWRLSAVNETTPAKMPHGKHISHHADGVRIPLGKVARRLRDWQTSIAATKPSDNVTRIRTTLLAGMGLLAAIGIFRFCISIRGLYELLRHSHKLGDARVNRTASRLIRQLGCRQKVEIRVSSTVDCAAVLGWRNPIVLLPNDWRDWTDEQLSCVIAHELAHVHRADFLWRTFSCLLVSLHYFNPLMHLLLLRLTLAQEATADLLATRMVGKEVYVKGLCQLALNREAVTTNSGARIAPFFSGYLIRRIEMLKSDSKRMTLTGSGYWKCGLVGLMLAIGWLVVAVRAVAEQPAVELSDEPVARVASSSPIGTLKRPESAADFKHEAIDLGPAAFSDRGLIVVRFAKIRSRLRTKKQGIDDFANQLISRALKDALSSPEEPPIDVSCIETLVGDLTLTTKFHRKDSSNRPQGEEQIDSDSDVDSHSHSLTLAAEFGQLMLNRPMNCSEWISRYVPESKQHDRDKKSIHVFAPFPGVDDCPLTVGNLDDRTVVMGNLMHRKMSDEKVVDQAFRLLDRPKESSTSKLASAFRRVDGGLVSFAINDRAIMTPSNLEDRYPPGSLSPEELAVSRAAHRVEHTFETLAFGFDLSEDNSTIGLRLRLAASEKEVAKTMLSDMETVRKIGLGLFRKSPEKNKIETKMLIKLLESSSLELVSNSDGTWEVVMESAVAAPPLLPEMFAALIKQELTDVEISE